MVRIEFAFVALLTGNVALIRVIKHMSHSLQNVHGGGTADVLIIVDRPWTCLF
jgi:hypothetical protein